MGIALMVLTSFLFTTMAALIKGLGTEFPPMEVVFWRSLFSLAILMFLVRRQKVPHFGRSHKNILLRSLSGLGAMFFYFYALPLLPLALCSFLYNTLPIWVAFLAPLMLGEKATVRTRVAIGLGIAGLAVMIKPGIHWGWPALFMLISAVFGAFAHIFIRKLGQTEHPLTVVFDFTLIVTIGAGLISIPDFILPNSREWLALVAIGILATAAQYAMTAAYALEEAPVVAAVGYVGILFSTFYDWVLWDKVVGPWAWAGGALIVAGGVQLVWKHIKRTLYELYYFFT
jgi:drug/metabolite transporter (DMT)-like permease